MEGVYLDVWDMGMIEFIRVDLLKVDEVRLKVIVIWSEPL